VEALAQKWWSGLLAGLLSQHRGRVQAHAAQSQQLP